MKRYVVVSGELTERSISIRPPHAEISSISSKLTLVVPRLWNDPRVSSEHARNVCIDFARVSPECRCESYRGHVGTPAPEGRHVSVGGDPLESRDHGDLALGEGFAESLGPDF